MSDIDHDRVSGIVSLYPQGIDSSMRTDCCNEVISNNQLCCPKCRRKVIGYSCDSDHERGSVRWGNATAGWNRKGKQ